MIIRFNIFLSCFIFLFASCATVPSRINPPLEVVSNVNIEKYLGRWYEIARYPNWFQENCYGATADYNLNKNGSISVINRCKENQLDGIFREAVGTANVVDIDTNAKLKVSFYWPFYGDYWIIGLGDNYEYSIVSEPKRQYLWILSRKSIINKNLYDKLIEMLEEHHFDTSLLIHSSQEKR